MFSNGPRWSTSYKFINNSQHFPTRDRLKRYCWDLKVSSLNVLVHFYKHFLYICGWYSSNGGALAGNSKFYSAFVPISISSDFRHAIEHPHTGPAHKNVFHGIPKRIDCRSRQCKREDTFFVICGKYFRFEVLWVSSWNRSHNQLI